MTQRKAHWPKFSVERVLQLKGLTQREKYHLQPGPKCVEKGCGRRCWWSAIEKRWRHDGGDVDPIPYVQKHEVTELE